MTQNLLKNNILFVTPSLNGGGAEKNLVNIINSLDDTLFSISLVIFYGNDNYLPLIDKKIDVYKLNSSNVKNGVFKLKSVLNKVSPDIVFTSAEHILLFISIYKIYNRSFKLIFRLPSLPSNNLYKGIKGKILSSITKYALKTCNYIICQTDEMKKEVKEFYGISGERVLFIRNMVNVRQILEEASKGNISLPKETYNIIASGSLYSAKGFDDLISAIKIVITYRKNVRLYILGEETVEKGYRKYLESLIADLSLENYVFLVGFVKNPYPYYKAANLFVLSSRKEGFPNVVLEALVLGTPVVATDCVNFEGIISESNGVVVKKGNHKALSEGILNINKNLSFNYTVLNFNYSSWLINLMK